RHDRDPGIGPDAQLLREWCARVPRHGVTFAARRPFRQHVTHIRYSRPDHSTFGGAPAYARRHTAHRGPAPGPPGGNDMALRLGDEAPDFTAESTEGTIKFHDYLGDGWGVLFSHPKDFTPVCTTELGRVAALKPEFEKRNTKIVGLSVDGLKDHKGWSKDIEETQGHALNFPLLADPEREVAQLYDMIHPN